LATPAGTFSYLYGFGRVEGAVDSSRRFGLGLVQTVSVRIDDTSALQGSNVAPGKGSTGTFKSLFISSDDHNATKRNSVTCWSKLRAYTKVMHSI
jgi:hypothetical protein